jgi:hypothetical protein
LNTATDDLERSDGSYIRLGLLARVPFLLDLMAAAELAEPAAAAFWRITGQEVPRSPAPEPPPGLTEDELDLWEPQPPVDLPRVRDWWKSNAARFDPAKRYQTGRNVCDAPLGPVFEQLPLAIRYDVFLRQRPQPQYAGLGTGKLAPGRIQPRSPDLVGVWGRQRPMSNRCPVE